MAIIIDGKNTAKEIRKEIKEKVAIFREKYGYSPKLSVILLGNDPASEIYVRNKENACRKVDMDAETIHMPDTTTTEELLTLIERLNTDEKVSGILVQLPVPKQIDIDAVLKAISPMKDVDGFHPVNGGMMLQKKALLEPCTPTGCIELLKRYGVPLEGAEAVVIGRSNLVGKPVSVMLQRENCTVTMCHSRTKDLESHVRRADIVIAAIGKPQMIPGEWIKEGAAVIDVGINRLEDGTVCGDVDFETVSRKAGFITPVPGGVGPMTVAMLLRNTLLAAEARIG